MKVLVTGGAGYIGSHTCLQLLEMGYSVDVVDDLSNSSEESLQRIQRLVGRTLNFYRADIRDKNSLQHILAVGGYHSVIHFAGLKAVGESGQMPLSYYDVNVAGTISLLQAMGAANVHRLIFSSSATVYGDPQTVPISESAERSATNPYGRTKLHIEEMLQDLAASDCRWKIALLRYFNPVGAHPSGEIGEDPRGIPNNLTPFITQVAVGRRPYLSIFGDDYPTKDGTGVRDYIHVVDLAQGHLAALQYLQSDVSGAHAFNLGTGTGYSVLEVLKSFEDVVGKPIPYRIVARRPGDIACCYADPGKANRMLGWVAKKTLHDMAADAWKWQSRNPTGYFSE